LDRTMRSRWAYLLHRANRGGATNRVAAAEDARELVNRALGNDDCNLVDPPADSALCAEIDVLE
jgi:hypothetical protein